MDEKLEKTQDMTDEAIDEVAGGFAPTPGFIASCPYCGDVSDPVWDGDIGHTVCRACRRPRSPKTGMIQIVV